MGFLQPKYDLSVISQNAPEYHLQTQQHYWFWSKKAEPILSEPCLVHYNEVKCWFFFAPHLPIAKTLSGVYFSIYISLSRSCIEMKRNAFILVCYLFTVLSTPAQMWTATGGNGMDHAIGDIWTDTVNQKLYLVGQFYLADTLFVEQSCKWDGYRFDTIGKGIGSVDWCYGVPDQCNQLGRFALHYGNVYVGGFQRFSGPPWSDYQTGIMWYNGVKWDSTSLPMNYFIVNEANGELFASGMIEDTTGLPAIMRRNDTLWEPFHPWFNTNDVVVMDMEYYQGHYYACGNFGWNTPRSDIVYWDGSEWHACDQGIPGLSGQARVMQIFGDLLWVGGNIYESEGNVSDFLQVWDGNQWYPCFQDVHFVNTVTQLEIFEGEMYILGAHYVRQNGNWRGPYHIAKYDGTTFCSFGGRDNYYLHDIGMVNEELYAAVQETFQFDTLNFFAKYAGGPADEICIPQNLPTASQPQVGTLPIQLVPNPSAEKTTVQGWLPSAQVVGISVWNMNGQMLHQLPVQSFLAGAFEVPIHLPDLPSGIYTIAVQTTHSHQFLRWVKQ